MLRRCTAASLAVLSVTFVIAGKPASAPAASVVSEMMVNGVDTIVPYGTPGSTMYAYYQLINPRSTIVGVGPKPIDDAIFSSVVPPTSIHAVDPMAGPLTIASGSTGFDRKALEVLMGKIDATRVGLGLIFGDGGLAPGGVLDFKVSLDPSYTSMTAPTLTLLAPYADLSATAPQLLSYTPKLAGGAPPPSTPEPASVALWSALACAGLLRARAFRRSRRPA